MGLWPFWQPALVLYYYMYIHLLFYVFWEIKMLARLVKMSVWRMRTAGDRDFPGH